MASGSSEPLDPYHAALEAAEQALMAAWGETDPARRQALLSDAARWVAAAQAANDQVLHPERTPDAGPD